MDQSGTFTGTILIKLRQSILPLLQVTSQLLILFAIRLLNVRKWKILIFRVKLAHHSKHSPRGVLRCKQPTVLQVFLAHSSSTACQQALLPESRWTSRYTAIWNHWALKTFMVISFSIGSVSFTPVILASKFSSWTNLCQAIGFFLPKPSPSPFFFFRWWQ